MNQSEIISTFKVNISNAELRDIDFFKLIKKTMIITEITVRLMHINYQYFFLRAYKFIVTYAYIFKKIDI